MRLPFFCEKYREEDNMNQQKSKETKSALLMVLTSIIWGVAFVFQRTGMEHIGPFAFNFFRCAISIAFLFFVNLVFTKKRRSQGIIDNGFKSKSLILGGVITGTALFFAMSTQQVGMVTTTAAKAGFITTMYIVIVPVMGIFYGRNTTPKVWLCVVIAAVGLYLLSIKNGLTIERGDFLVFISAIFFALQIVFVDIFSPKTDSVRLCMVQFATSGILSLLVVIFKESITVEMVRSAFVAIVFTGLFSSGIGFTLQIIAQKDLPATITSLIMSSEAVVSVIAGVIFLGESLSNREMVGCIILVIAVFLAQINIPVRQKNLRDSENNVGAKNNMDVI